MCVGEGRHLDDLVEVSILPLREAFGEVAHLL